MPETKSGKWTDTKRSWAWWRLREQRYQIEVGQIGSKWRVVVELPGASVAPVGHHLARHWDLDYEPGPQDVIRCVLAAIEARNQWLDDKKVGGL